MRRLVCILLATASVSSAALPVAAQAPAHAAPFSYRTSPTVALVDVVKVFDHHPRFKQQMDSIRNEIQAFERELGQQQETLGRMNEQLSAADADRRSQIEAEMTRRMADLQMKAQLKRNEILEREAKIYYETYNEVVAEVSRLADSYGISLVLRYDSTGMDPQDRGSVLKGVNRPIVLQRNLDLTDELIGRLGGRVSQASSPGGPTRPSDRSLSTRIPFSGGYSN